MTSRSRHTRSLATKTAELAFVVPQVVTHRLTRMALAGPQPSLRDQREMRLMVDEKSMAWAQSWMAMSMAGWKAGWDLWSRMLWAPWLGPRTSTGMGSAWQDATLRVMSAGLAPVHRKATANARRLTRSR